MSLKIAIHVPGCDRLRDRRDYVDGKIHPLWRRLYEQLNKSGAVAEYIGYQDISDQTLADYTVLFLVAARRLTRDQEQVISRFVRSRGTLCISGAVPLAREFGISVTGTMRQNSLLWQGQIVPYRAIDERGVRAKVVRRIFPGNRVSVIAALVPAARVRVSAEHEILAVWQNGGWPALTCSHAFGGKVVYFSGILAGAEGELLQYIITLVAGDALGRAPVLPPGKKCGVTLFHDFEGIYGDPRQGESDAAGVRSMLALEKKYRIRATFNTVCKLAETAPETIQQIIADGHEMASHTYEHVVPRQTRRADLEASLLNCRRVFRERFGQDIVGFRSPQSGWSADLIALLARHGFQWDAEDEAATLPYHLVLNRQLPLLRLPVSGDDYGYISGRLSPAAMLAQFKRLVAQGIESSGFVSIGFHPWIEGRDPEKLTILEEFFAYLTARPEVAVMTFGDVCAWWNRRAGLRGR